MRSIVSPLRVAKIADENLPRQILLDHTMKFGLSCYESGMLEVIRDLAIDNLTKGGFTVEKSKQTREYLKQSEEKYRQFLSVLTPQQRTLFEEFERVFEMANSSETGDHFVTGFIRGYRHLKSHMTFNTDFKGDYENE